MFALPLIMVLSKLIIINLAVSVPACRWVYDEEAYQAADICLSAIAGGDTGPIDLKYECISNTVHMNIYLPNSGCTGNIIHTVKTIIDTSKFDCSKTICSSNAYAIWKNHYAPSACSLYSNMALITDICLPVDDHYYITSVYNDPSMTPSLGIESIFYSDDQCSVVSDCYRWSTNVPDPCLNEIDITSLLVSYTASKTKPEADCTTSDGGNNGYGDTSYNISSVDMDCNWVYWREWYHVVGICGQDRFDGDWYDTHIICNGTGTSVSQLYYDSNDKSCSGNMVHREFITADSKYFKCSSTVCEYNYMSFRRYDSCNKSVADIGQYNVITNQCFRNVEDGTNYFASCNTSNIGDGYRYGYDADGMYLHSVLLSYFCYISQIIFSILICVCVPFILINNDKIIKIRSVPIFKLVIDLVNV